MTPPPSVCSHPLSPHQSLTPLTTQLYTKEFYENIVLKKLAPGGIFVTQSGPAGVLSAHEVFAPIRSTLRAVFPTVHCYTEHIPSYCDVWSWCMAFSDASMELLSPEELDRRAKSRIRGELSFLDGATLASRLVQSKQIRRVLEAETHILTADDPRFIHGAGSCTL